MKVEILKDCKASRDGVTLEQFFEGDILSVPEKFAMTLLNAGYAGRYKELRVDWPQETPEKQNKTKVKRRKK